MSLIERYVFRMAGGAFLAILFGLTAIIWLTQALREVDLITAKGQSIFVFFIITGLTIPSLLTLIAPFALFGGSLYALNKLNGDSELVVMSAAGVSPARLMRPFAILSVIVALGIGASTLAAMPWSFREIRALITKIRSDFLSRVVQEGAFAEMDSGFMFHYRQKGPNGELMGILMQDQRDPAKMASYLAEVGKTAEIDGRTYLSLEKGSIQRLTPGARDPAIVVFERYALDLDQFSGIADATLKPRERATGELMSPQPDDPLYKRAPGRFRAELQDRLISPFYALIGGLIAFATLGRPKTIRQTGGMAVLIAVLIFGAVRIAGVGALSLVARSASGVPALWAIPIVAGLVGFGAIFGAERLKALWARRQGSPRPSGEASA